MNTATQQEGQTTQEVEQVSTEEGQQLVDQDSDQTTEQSSAPEHTADTNETDDEYEKLVSQYNEAIDGKSNDEPVAKVDAEDTGEPASESEKPAGTDNIYRDPRVDVLHEDMQARLQKDANEAFDETVKSIKGEVPAFASLPDVMVRGIMEKQVRDDPRLLQAFRHRNLDPKGYNDIIMAKAKSLEKDIRALPDTSATKGREFMRSSVNGQPSGAAKVGKYTTEQINDMSEAEFLAAEARGEFG